MHIGINAQLLSFSQNYRNGGVLPTLGAAEGIQAEGLGQTLLG